MPTTHIVIAGVYKCGTTSVFRYLADHPDVCASRVKETRFFDGDPEDSAALSYTNYLSYFAHRKNESVLLEASPSYFSAGIGTATRIKGVLPEARIVVFLRNPVERLFSYYRSALVYDNNANALLTGLSFGEFVDIALAADSSEEETDARRREFRRELRRGCYVGHIDGFGTQFSKDQSRYIFFEDLACIFRRS